MENLAYGERIFKAGFLILETSEKLLIICYGESLSSNTLLGQKNGIKSRISSVAAKVIKLNLVSKCLK